MLSDRQKQLILDSWRLVLPIADTAADLFYKRLFELRPEYRPFFGEDISGQKKKLLQMLSFVVKSLDWIQEQWEENIDPEEDLFYVVLALGRRHSRLYKIPDEAYAPVGEALLWTLDYGLGDAFTPEVKESWTAAYSWLALTMKASGKLSRYSQQTSSPQPQATPSA